ncbi:metal ABC transporter permease [Rubrobacter taiwanensis]|uniref:Metal ABC transporter permease n=1 Tax=Rubrobacter taiwanensis TaxID=185139 RepID=A0A4R1BSJ2_9ACTN|nr:metal ABC transporter permease [Rubrobacter taiwanensis]TCJ20760.1 metal ABC transporter permease [Rubrobacter taiwanensis]
MSADLVIIVTGILVAVPCALLGTLLVLRQMAMVGDAISHAVLPGIVLAFFISGSLGPLTALAGAGVFGVLTAVLIQALRDTGRVREDSSIGIVFTALFALGVFLISKFASSVHLDLEHVLYGEIAYAPINPLVVGGTYLGPRTFWTLGIVTVLAAGLVLALYKELKVSTFDPALATALGLSPALVHYLLMGAVSVTVVGAFDAVGAILVVAFLIVPPAAAYLVTERLSHMMLVAVLLGTVSAVAGYYLAAALDVAIAGAMTVVAGGLFALAALLSPAHGLLAHAARRYRSRRAFARELVLARLAALGGSAPEEELARALGWERRELARTLRSAARGGLVETAGGEVRVRRARSGAGRERRRGRSTARWPGWR